MKETEYVVLLGGAEQYKWRWIGHASASGANTAKRRAVAAFRESNPEVNLEGMHCVAVPLSSWKPEPVEVEVQERLKIG